jgi:hypothetical protein
VNVAETGGYASTIEIATAGTGYTNGDLITVTSGTSNATFTIVIAGRNTWRFDQDGRLTIPSNTVNSMLYTENSGYRLVLEGNNGGVATAKLELDNDNGHIRLKVGNVSTPAIWAFRDNGNLTLPSANFDASPAPSSSPSIVFPSEGYIGASLETASEKFLIKSEGKTWTFDGSYEDLTFPGGTVFSSQNIVVVANANLTVTTFDGTSHFTTFGLDGNLILPETGYLRVGTGIVAGFASSPAPIISGFSSISAENFTFLGNGVNILSTVGAGGTTDRLTNGGSEVALQANGVTTFGNTATISNNGGEFRIWADNDISVYRNGRDGYGVTENEVKVFADNTQITATTPNGLEILQGNLVIPNDKAVVFANGVNILSTVGGGAYGNTQVASYLLNFDGDIEFTSSTARIGNVDVITVMDSIRSPAYQFSNGVSIFSGITGTYSNTNVAAYLTTATITTTGNITAGNLTTSGTYTVANITTTGAYGNITGANVISANTVSATNYLFANGVNILSTVPGTYSNANVTAYLTTGPNITTANLTTTGNVVQQSAYYETYANVTNSGGNLTCNFVNGSTFYATLTANVTVNFTNVVATAGRVTGATLIVDQGATAYRVANIQINSGGVQTIKYAGGTPNTGTASNTDIMSFSLISLDGTNWRILGQIANYG